MVRVTCPKTCFGIIEKDFSTWDEASKWIQICVANNVDVTVTTLD